MKQYSRRQLRRALAKYPCVQVPVEIGDQTLSLTCIRDPYELLDRMIEQEQRRVRVERFPYWAEVWPAAIGLARWLEAGQLGRPQEALELGCGVGLVSVVLARMGCRVTATDFVEDALMLAHHNAQINGAGALHGVDYLDWRHPVGRPVPLLVASDVAYEKKNHDYLLRTIRLLLKKGGTFCLSDPQRPATRAFVAQLLDRGFGHRRAQVEVRLKALRHSIDIYVFEGVEA